MSKSHLENKRLDDDSEILNPETREKRESLFKTLRSKFMVMAMAGFVTLGGAWQESYADQLRLAKQEGKPPQFLLEQGITERKLTDFREKLEKEELEFVTWVERYADHLGEQLDQVFEDILNNNSEIDLKQENDLKSVVGEMKDPIKTGLLKKVDESIRADHDILTFLAREPDSLIRSFQFLKANLKNIIMSLALLDDSKDVRQRLKESKNFPTVIFYKHFEQQLKGQPAAFTFPIPWKDFKEVAESDKEISSDKFHPQIVLFPQSFLDHDGSIGINQFISNFVHELMHAIRVNSSSGGMPDYFSGTRSILTEGIAENRTYEIIQYLGQLRPELRLRPDVSFNAYDFRVVLMSILEAVAREGKRKDVIALWDAGIVDDKYLTSNLKETFTKLNLSHDFIKDIEMLNKEIDLMSPVFEIIVNLLVDLNMRGVKLSPGFIASILTHGRVLDDWQIKKVDTSFVRGSLREEVAKRVDK